MELSSPVALGPRGRSPSNLHSAYDSRPHFHALPPMPLQPPSLSLSPSPPPPPFRRAGARRVPTAGVLRGRRPWRYVDSGHGHALPSALLGIVSIAGDSAVLCLTVL